MRNLTVKTTPKVVITQWVHQEVVDYLSPHCELTLNMTRQTLARAEVIQRTRDAQAIMVFMSDAVDEDFLKTCPKLKVVGAALKGYDNFDMEACTKHGAWFTIVPDLLTIPTAELTLGLLIAVARNMSSGDNLIRSGSFTGWRPALYGAGLYQRVVGIIGMGNVGQAVAKRLLGFDTSVIYHDIQRLPQNKEAGLRVTPVSLDALLRRSDFVLLTLPLTSCTKHLIHRGTIATMKRGSYIINTGRGSVVDECAVAEALKSGHLAGYAADVFEMEDWARLDRPRHLPEKLLALKDKTFFTPHLGSAVDEVRLEVTMEAARNIVQVLKGERPQGAVNDPITVTGPVLG